jgi:hypothetical protein
MEYLYDVVKRLKRWPDLNECGVYARKELMWLRAFNGGTKDSIAWFTEQLSLWYINKGNPMNIEYLRKQYLTQDDITLLPFDLCYSFVQQGKISEARAFLLLRVLSKSKQKYLQLKKSEWEIIITLPHLRADSLSVLLSTFATAGQTVIVDSNMAFKCAPEFLRKPFDYKLARNLLRDTECGMYAITSMNALRTLHDEQADAIRTKARLKDKATYIHDADFSRLCRKYGWQVPKGAADLVMRGHEHRNCVASYRPKHTTNFGERGPYTVSRILLRDDATAEIRLSTKRGKISDASLIQCKGSRNVDRQFPEWSDMREELIGMPASIVTVDTALIEE